MRFGAHVSAAGGIQLAVGRAREIGAESIQVFTQSSRMWRPTTHAEADLAAFAEQAGAAGLPTVCHAIYFINLASDDPELHAKSVTALATTTTVGRAIGAEGIVFHVGSHKGAGLDGALPRIVDGIHQALEHAGPDQWLLLENSAGAGGTIGRDLDELARVFRAVDHPRVGVCIDTCHIFVSGVDIRDRATADRLVDDIDAAFGLERLRCLHVNDSQADVGTNRDRHANIGEGLIGEGLGVLLSHPALQHLPAIVETAGPEGNGPDRAELDRLRAIHAAGVAARA